MAAQRFCGLTRPRGSIFSTSNPTTVSVIEVQTSDGWMRADRLDKGCSVPRRDHQVQTARPTLQRRVARCCTVRGTANDLALALCGQSLPDARIEGEPLGRVTPLGRSSRSPSTRQIFRPCARSLKAPVDRDAHRSTRDVGRGLRGARILIRRRRGRITSHRGSNRPTRSMAGDDQRRQSIKRPVGCHGITDHLGQITQTEEIVAHSTAQLFFAHVPGDDRRLVCHLPGVAFRVDEQHVAS